MEEETMEMVEMDSFLEYFMKNHRDDNFSTIKYGNYEIKKQDLEGEILDWTLQYLQYMSCPASLEAGLAKAVLDETKLSYLNEDQPDGGGGGKSGKQAFTSLALLQNVTVTVSEVCRRLKKEENFRKSFVRSKNLYPCSVCAIRNGRKKMEDRHIVIHDVNAIFKPQRNNDSNEDILAKNGDESDDRASFYGVFDGHVGKDAAAFTAAHLHQFLLQSEYYPSDPIKATYEAFQKTNSVYEKKTEKEDKALKCGTTVVFTLILGRKMYISWLGDSQVLLVRNGCPVRVVTPHKPDRKDERERIAEAGGTVILYGQWRVNGLLAVSRSIGDFEHKSFISAEPDVTSVEMNDTEDFVILASDGLWDYLSYDKINSAIFEHLVNNAKTNGEIEKLSQELANLAKQNGSGDNISIIVIFLKPVQQLIQEHLSREDDKGDIDVQKQYFGILSTCKYLTQIMSTGEETLLTSSAVKEGAFSSPGGGGMTFGGNFSPDGRINDSDENEEQFRRASDSMFKEGNDFMSNTDNAWIQPAGNNHNSNNPFLPDIGVTRKPDSGFISPACNSSNKSSDEDRKEDEEFLESQEVSKLLGGRPMEELLSRDTPTPPVDETGSSLEEILAAARDNPDSVGEVDDDDSDESSTDDPKPLPLKDSNSNQSANQNVSDSDEENDEGDFTFVKEESQVKNLLADIHGDAGELENSSKPELSNGHHQDNEDEGEGPSSVIIESQETPNPDSASFILKTMNSEAPELPSPQEPIVEVIMEGVGKASPIFEEVEEEDRHSLPSPQCNKTGKESSELECGEEIESSSISFQCKDDDANFVLKTPNPADSTPASKEANLHPAASSGAEESDCEPQFPEHAKEGEEELERDNVVSSDHPQEEEEIIEEMIEAQHVVSIGAHSLPPVHMENEAKPNTDGEELKDDEEKKDQGHKTEISSDDESENKKDIINDAIVPDAPVSPEPQPLVDIVPADGNAETAHDEYTKPTNVPEKSEVDNELIQLDDGQKDEEIKEGTGLQEEVVEQPIIEAESKAEVTASVEIPDKLETEVVSYDTKIESSVGEENEAKDEDPAVVQKEVVSPFEADKTMESLPEADKAVESLPEALESIEKITEKVVTSKTNEKVAASAPTSKGGSPKKEAKVISKRPTPSTTKSASSSPKKTLSGSTAPSSAKSTLNRRPASATKTASSVSKATPKATGVPSTVSKPGSATRTLSATKSSGGVPSKTMSSSSRPSTTKSTTSSTLTKKPFSTSSSSSRTTSATSSTLRSARPASGEVKSKVDSASKREPLSKVGSKPISRVGSVTKPSAAMSQVKSNGTTAATASTTRKPISSRTTPTSSTLSKRTTPSSDSSSRATSTKSGTTVRSTITSSRTTTSSSTTKAAGGTLTKRPTNVSARVSTGLSRPKSSSSSVKPTAKPTENGATTSPKASPVNGNDVTPSKEAVP